VFALERLRRPSLFVINCFFFYRNCLAGNPELIINCRLLYFYLHKHVDMALRFGNSNLVLDGVVYIRGLLVFNLNNLINVYKK